MRSLSISIHIILFFVFLSEASAQLNLTVGEKFLDGKAIKLVFVAVNDQSVWALTTDGKVYLKRQNELDFLLYQPTAMFNIEQVTGFNENEMFFLLKPDIIIHFKAGIKYEIKVPFPEVTRINDIAAVHSNTTSTYYINNPSIVLPDYLAVATNKHLYKLIRGDLTVSQQVPYSNPPVVNEPEWRMTNKGYKSMDFQYLYQEFRYCQTADHTTINYIGGPISYVSVLPDQAPNYSKVNASLIALDWRKYFTSYRMNFWGNDNGLYVQSTYHCGSIIKQAIVNEKINDLEEIFALTPIYRQNFVLAATDNGLYYTPASIFHELYGYNNSSLDRVNFVKHTLFPNEKVYSICLNTKQESVIDISSGAFALSVCEKIIWVASSTGLRKVYALLDQDYYNDFLYSDFHYLANPKDPTDYTKKTFETCGNQTIQITAKIPEVSKSEVLIRWYKDNIEVSDWVDKLTVNLSESGTYKVKITVLCEEISLTSIPIIIINNAGPEITFNPPANVNICNAQPYVMETKNINTYSYQWYKDDIRIPSATQFHYTAITSGKYRVEVNNSTCPGPLSSPSVNINFINMPIPQLIQDKTSYCIGDVAQLSVTNQGYDIKWYLDGVEIAGSSNQDMITTVDPGTYEVEFSSENCSNKSTGHQITFNQLPVPDITRSSNRILCYGETVDLIAIDIPGATYLWSNGEETRKITVGEAGKYKVTITNTSNCSSTSNEIDVFVNEELRFESPHITSIKKDYCIDETAVLNVDNSNGLRTKWYLNDIELPNYANHNQITPTIPGNYRVEFLNTLDCPKSSAEFPITFNNKLNIMITSSVSRTICEGESVKLSAGVYPNASYLWSNGEETENINVSTSGKYSVQVTSQFSCISVSDEVDVVVNPLPLLTPNEQLKLCIILKEEVKLNADPGYAYYTWNGKRGIEPHLTVNQPGLYTVIIEDINGCRASKTFQVNSYCKEIIAPNAFSPNGDGINDIWKVSGLENMPNANLKIFNRLGTKMYERRGNNLIWDGNIDNSPAPVGVYYYVITSTKLQTVKGTITLIR
jgi:gliding motility-associated-like protein